MAGILAPTISETQGGAGGVAMPVDTSVGDALTGFSRVFGGVADFLTPEESAVGTQTDRDRIALQEPMQRALSLRRKRQAGSLLPAEYRTRITALTNETIAAFPDKAELVRNAFGSILGEEVGETAEDPTTARRNMLVSLIADPNNTQAQRVYMESFTVDNTGQFDDQSTFLKFEQNWMRYQARLAQVEEMELMARRLTAEDAVGQAEQQRNVEAFVAEGTAAAQRFINGLTSTYPIILGNQEGKPSVDAVQSAITELKEARAQYLNDARVMATRGGFLDNIERTFEGGVDAIVAPFDNVLSFLERLSTEDKARFEQLQSEDKMFMVNAAMGAGAPVPTLVVESEPFQVLLLDALRTEMGVGIQNLKNNREALERTPLNRKFGKDPEKELLDENGDPSPEMEPAKNALSTSEKREQVRKGVSKFKTLATLSTDEPFVRQKMVNEFILATETMNGLKIAEETFDNVYDPQFFDVYNLVQVRGGNEADALTRAIERNLVGILKQRELAADVGIKGALGNQFPSFQLTFDGQKFDVTNSRPNKTNNLTVLEARVMPLLRKHNLSFDLEGLQRLRRLELDKAPALGLNTFLGEIEDELRYLNKIVGVIQKFPEEVRNNIMPPVSTRGIPVIDKPEDLSGVVEGQQYEVEYTDGTVHRFVRGQENLGPINE